MTLDLTGGGALSPEHARRLDAIADEIRLPFHALIAELGEPHKDNLDWWVTPVASRNTFSSDLFLRCCQAVLAVRLAAAESAPRRILVDSPALAATIQGGLADRPVAVHCLRPAWFAFAGRLALRLRRLAAVLYTCAGRYVASRIWRPRVPAPSCPIALVDTVIAADSLDDSGKLRDHYYPGLLECLSAAEQAAVYFVPTLYRVRRYGALFRRLRASRQNWLLPDDYLHLADYFRALTHPLRTPRGLAGKLNVAALDVTPLVREAMALGFAASGSIEAILRERFARRLKERSVRLRLALEWFENQEVDRGAVTGLRTHFPDTPIIGYQGYVVSRHYLCRFPTEQERLSGVLPHRVAVIGSALVEPAREFSPALEVEVAPAFRFRGLWVEREHARDCRASSILAALPLFPDEAKDILARLISATEAGSAARPWRIRLKPHPLMPAPGLLAALGRPLPDGWEVVAGDLDDLIAEAGVLVSSASSACMQALAAGVPAVVMGSLRGLTQNPIPASIDRRLWALCYTADEVRATLERFGGRTEEEIRRDRVSGRNLRDEYFSPVTRQSVARLLRLE